MHRSLYSQLTFSLLLLLAVSCQATEVTGISVADGDVDDITSEASFEEQEPSTDADRDSDDHDGSAEATPDGDAGADSADEPTEDFVDAEEDAPVCVNTSDCSDGKACNGQEVCHEGQCFADSTFTCDDGLTCTEDTCFEPSGCRHSPIDSRCADLWECTVDSCNAQTGCVHAPDDSACGFNQFCDPDNAGAGADGCVVKPPCTVDTDCDDQLPCTLDVCDAANSCTHTPDHAACDDGFDCTTDACTTTTGCTNQPNNALCSDNDLCNGVESCDPEAAAHDSAGCVTTGALDCDDAIPCTADTCNATAGCSHQVNHALCDDGIACTADICVVGAGCTTMPDDAKCNQSSGQICVIQIGCVTPNICTTAADCDDGLFCNGAEICANNACRRGAAPDCNDGIGCTVDDCNETDHCINTPDHSFCDDTDACTTDTCTVGVGCLNTVTKDTDEDGAVDIVCPGGTDCDDADDAISPSKLEVCNNGFDDNCDGLTDTQDTVVCGDCSPPCGAAERCYNSTCYPADHPCFWAMDNVITSDSTVTFRYPSTKYVNPINSTVSACQYNTPGPEIAVAARAKLGYGLDFTIYPPGTYVTYEAIYVTTDCFNINTCQGYDYAASSDESYMNWANDEPTAGQIYYAFADWRSTSTPSTSNRTMEVTFYDPSSCDSTSGAGFSQFAMGLLLLLIVLRGISRRRTNA